MTNPGQTAFGKVTCAPPSHEVLSTSRGGSSTFLEKTLLKIVKIWRPQNNPPPKKGQNPWYINLLNLFWVRPVQTWSLGYVLLEANPHVGCTGQLP